MDEELNALFARKKLTESIALLFIICSKLSGKTKLNHYPDSFWPGAEEFQSTEFTESVGRNGDGMFLLHYCWHMGCAFSSWRIAVIMIKILICLYQPQISCVRLFCSFWSTQETIMKTPSRRRRALSAVAIPHVTRTVQSTKYSRYASMVLRRESERYKNIVNFTTRLLVCHTS